MEKSEVLRKFLEKGFQLDFESLDFFSKNPTRINEFFDKLSMGEKPTIISLNIINEILKDQNTKIEIIKSLTLKKNTVSIDEMTKIISNRYQVLKKILSSRLDLINPISLNKITPKTKHFSTIVMVKEKVEEERAIVVEDETDQKTFFFDNNDDFNQIYLDDVIGVVCSFDEKIRIKTVTWPDIQMKRLVNKTTSDVNIAIILSKFSEDLKKQILKTKAEINYIIFIENSEKITLSNSVKMSTTSPSTMKIEQIIFLIVNNVFFSKYQKLLDDEQSFIISFLKRRNLDPTFNFKDGLFVEDPFLIETIPDVFVVSGTKNSITTNYKGTTVIGLQKFETSKKFVVINLKSRETINVSLG